MSKTVTLRLDDEVYEELKAARRPLSNLIETAVLRRVREEQFVDDAEMAEIRADVALLERLRTGSTQARVLKGSFVECAEGSALSPNGGRRRD